jgi:hypothetical protein
MLRPRLARFRFALLAIISCTLIAAAAHAKSAPRNLLSNPGFEQPLVDTLGTGIPHEHPWMPAAWDTTQSGLPTVFFGRDSLLVHGGSYAVSVANLSVLFPMGHNWSQKLLVGREAWGKDLVFSVWTRTNGLDGRAYILLQAYRDTISKMAMVWGVGRDEAAHTLNIKGVDDPLIDLGWKREFFTTPETDWVRREARVYCPPSVNIVFVRCGMLGTGQVIFDDASLTLEAPLPAKAPAVGENLLADPSFEGDTNDWEFSVPPYRGMRIDPESTVVHGGRRAIRCASGEGEYVKTRAGACQSICNRALAGKRVRLTAWVKTDSLRGNAYTKIYAHTLRGMRQVPQGQGFGASTDWSPTTLEMDLPPDTFEVWAWLAWDAPVTGRVFYDDAKLEVIGPAHPAPAPPGPTRKR